MQKILLAWLGKTDYDASQGKPEVGQGPIASAVETFEFDRIELLCNYPQEMGEEYKRWLTEQYLPPVIRLIPCDLANPTDYQGIYTEAERAVKSLPADASLFFHTSPGTPAMATVWILLAQTRYRSRSVLIQSSPQRGVEKIELPFDVYAEFFRASDDEFIRHTQGLPPATSAFETIIYRCDAMKRAVALARRCALRDVPVLIQGESGTGKELLARAIHKASSRAEEPFLALNCGALSSELVDSELFGHKKGAFTDAKSDKPGLFKAADKGILFLDEIGELPLPAQVRLLRTLQEGTIRPVGSPTEETVDVRVLAATHRNLLEEVAAGRFREDLFYRLAVGLVQLPPLRERKGDLNLLADHLLATINEDAANMQPGYTSKKILPAARTLLHEHSWPGNVRELKNVLTRASILATSNGSISKQNLQDSLFHHPETRQNILTRPLGQGFNINTLCMEIQSIYIRRALRATANNRTKAATGLLGLKSRQNLDDMIDRVKKAGFGID
jgi:transcriptional regulator with PAS, ATPase and Fis domain